MAQVAEEIGLGKHLRLSRGEERSGLRQQEHRAFQYHGSSDGRAVSRWWPGACAGLCPRPGDGRGRRASGQELRSGAALGNYKSALQERLQAARPARPFTVSRAKAVPTTTSAFLSRSAER